MEKELCYRGKNIKELSKEELLEAVHFLLAINERLLKEKQHERSVLRRVRHPLLSEVG